nr:MAG TPA: hypothetical protein [Microviridae sp.]
MACPLPPSPLLRWGQWHFAEPVLRTAPPPVNYHERAGDYSYLTCNRQVTPRYKYIVVLSL